MSGGNGALKVAVYMQRAVGSRRRIFVQYSRIWLFGKRALCIRKTDLRHECWVRIHTESILQAWQRVSVPDKLAQVVERCHLRELANRKVEIG